MFTILNAFNTSRELNTYKHNLEWSLQFISGLASINKQKRRYCIKATLAHACSGRENGQKRQKGKKGQKRTKMGKKGLKYCKTFVDH